MQCGVGASLILLSCHHHLVFSRRTLHTVHQVML